MKRYHKFRLSIWMFTSIILFLSTGCTSKADQSKPVQDIRDLKDYDKEFISLENNSENKLLSNVGIRLVSVNSPSTNSEIKGIIWYPTLENPRKTKLGPFEENVAENAKIKNGKHGFIIISHGTQGSHVGHRDTAIYLAMRDYIVISILHPKDNYLDDSDSRTAENWINRPRHISALLNSILTDSEYVNYIDENRIAIIGFSAGGYTALSVVGGVPDTVNIIKHCSENKSDDSDFCGAPSFYYKIIDLFSSQNVIQNTHDHRIKAAVLLAPVGVLFKDKKSLSKVNVPIRIYRAEKDNVNRFPYHAAFIRQKLGTKPEYVVVKNAGHYSFMSPFPDIMKQHGGVITKDPEGFDRIKFHSIMNQEIFEFLIESLKK